MSAPAFSYDRFEIDSSASTLTCRYRLGAREFTEKIHFPGLSAQWSSPVVEQSARLVFLLAGVSYFKTAAPMTIDLGDLVTTEIERRFLRTFMIEGLGEFAWKNGIDLSRLSVEGPDAGGPLRRLEHAATSPMPSRPLVPFGGGIDSIVTVAHVSRSLPHAALFIVDRPDDRIAAIENAAAVTGLPVVRAERQIDPCLFDSQRLGFLNGHVPVTGIISAIAVLAAALDGRDAVIMSNEASSSDGTIDVGGRVVNHQWSKGVDFEAGFRQLIPKSIDFFSLLRSCSELWVAREFSSLKQFRHVFRSCNRSFFQDPTRRLSTWCGTCDKCAFIDLVLAPFLDRKELDVIFDGSEPLANASMRGQFDSLIGVDGSSKPFECVGDVDECRGAVALAARRSDRADTAILSALAASLSDVPNPDALFDPRGPSHVPSDLDLFRDQSEPATLLG